MYNGQSTVMNTVRAFNYKESLVKACEIKFKN